MSATEGARRRELRDGRGLLPKAPPGHAPLRGTQSFVGVMASVWKRPLLTAAEVFERWVVGAFAVVWLWRRFGALLWPQGIAESMSAALTPAEVSGWLRDPHLWRVGVPWLVAWCAASALGRSWLLRRMDGAMRPRWSTLFALTLLRVSVFTAVVVAWASALLHFAERARIGYGPLGTNPDVVSAFAKAVGLTLLLFVVWSLVSWIVRLAVVIAAAEGGVVVASVRACFRNPALRSKLVEINLVMGIVKVALIVLAMVLSSSPLPFQGVATPAFLTNWWIFTVVMYLLESDFFHVVRQAVEVALYRALKQRD